MLTHELVSDRCLRLQWGYDLILLNCDQTINRNIETTFNIMVPQYLFWMCQRNNFAGEILTKLRLG